MLNLKKNKNPSRVTCDLPAQHVTLVNWRRVEASSLSLALSAALVCEGEFRMAFNGLKFGLEKKIALFSL